MKFYDNDLFCNNCLTHERFWSGGGSWTPDMCLCKSDHSISWKQMTEFQKEKAKKIYEKMDKKY